MRGLAIIVMLASLSACSFTVLDTELPKYIGEDINTLVDKLGYPNAEHTIMGRKAYIWSTGMDYVSVTPTRTTSTGYAGTTPVSTTSTSYQTNTTHLSCMIRVFVDEDNIVQNIEYEGNNGACYRYSNRLKD